MGGQTAPLQLFAWDFWFLEASLPAYWFTVAFCLDLDICGNLSPPWHGEHCHLVIESWVGGRNLLVCQSSAQTQPNPCKDDQATALCGLEADARWWWFCQACPLRLDCYSLWSYQLPWCSLSKRSPIRAIITWFLVFFSQHVFVLRCIDWNLRCFVYFYF